MANRYWVGGTGTWNTTNTDNWSTTSGGTSGASVPTVDDNAFFDQNSGTLNVTVVDGVTARGIGVYGDVSTTGSITFTGDFIQPTAFLEAFAGVDFVFESTATVTIRTCVIFPDIGSSNFTVDGVLRVSERFEVAPQSNPNHETNGTGRLEMDFLPTLNPSSAVLFYSDSLNGLDLTVRLNNTNDSIREFATFGSIKRIETAEDTFNGLRLLSNIFIEDLDLKNCVIKSGTSGVRRTINYTGDVDIIGGSITDTNMSPEASVFNVFDGGNNTNILFKIRLSNQTTNNTLLTNTHANSTTITNDKTNNTLLTNHQANNSGIINRRTEGGYTWNQIPQSWDNAEYSWDNIQQQFRPTFTQVTNQKL